ncbi:hypothetical protein SteCoe_29854 [Stentor coeruleus]|uniref:RCC1-like domain-containing protein n=1 Tax=Stentor coeruleus TaxID=5963 RepID=A0A1R2B4X8_9CILI|nr:hypothetical protein SteCoe_29854 [Stentor coeruleus]
MDSYTEVFAWGSDDFGQLGLGGAIGKSYPSPRLCTFNVLIKEISCGEEHAAFISSQGHVYTMGNNSDGRLGIDDKEVNYSSSPCLVSFLSGLNPITISCGWGHTACITQNGSLYTWGLGDFGALGLGNSLNQYSPQKVQLPDNSEAQSVSCGSRHTAILLKNKRLAMIGCGEAGQLGTRKREKEFFPVIIEAENVVQVSSGVFHTAFINNKGQVFTMGGNSYGQLGHGNKKSTSTPERVKALDGIFIIKISCGYCTGAICENGFLYLWGSGTFGEYLVPYKVHLPSRVKDLSIGSTFAVVVLQDMSVYTWGNNTNGELGLADTEPRSMPTLIPGVLGKKINQISCGGSFCIALSNDVIRQRTPTRTQNHMRSYSKAETTEQRRRYRQDYSSDFTSKTTIFQQEPTVIENTNQVFKNKNPSVYIEKNIQSYDYEIIKLKEENQQLFLRNQEIQNQCKNSVNEIKQLKEENYMLKRNLDSLKNNHSLEIEDVLNKALAQCENINRELDQERTTVKAELQGKILLEQSYQRLKDENSKLNKQVEELLCQIHDIENHMNIAKNEEINRNVYEKENFNHILLNKDLEIDKLSKSHHEIMIQINRLVEENKIYKQNNIELEEKNKKLFENLEKELAARAKDYKERTLTMLNGPINDRENRRSTSPNKVKFTSSPVILGKGENTYKIDNGYKGLRGERTESYSRTTLSETMQSRIGNTAARLLARMENDSALANMRISSPSRRSPERPVPFRAHKVGKEVREILRTRMLEYRE